MKKFYDIHVNPFPHGTRLNNLEKYKTTGIIFAASQSNDSNDRGKYKLLMFFILCINVLLKEIYWFAAFGHFMPEKFSIIQFRCPMFVDARVLKKLRFTAFFPRLEIHGALGDSKYFVGIDEISFSTRLSVSFESSKLCVLSMAELSTISDSPVNSENSPIKNIFNGLARNEMPRQIHMTCERSDESRKVSAHPVEELKIIKITCDRENNCTEQKASPAR